MNMGDEGERMAGLETASDAFWPSFAGFAELELLFELPCVGCELECAE